MRRKTLQTAVALALCAPLGALAQQLEQFDMVDTIPWPSLGRFPAYPAEQLRPTQVYVHAGWIRDTNVFRLADGVNTTAITGNPSRGDTIMRTGAGIRHEQRIVGRQSVRLAARGDYHSFDTYSQMDHFAYGLLGEWLWEFTNDLSGTVGWEHRKRLVDLAQLQRPVDQMVTENNAYANGAYRLGPNVRLRGGLNGVRQKRDAAEAVESRSTSVLGGVDYVTPLGNSVGVEARRSDGNSPVTPVLGAPPVDNEFDEREVALVATWVATQQIRFNGRFGRTERQHETFPGLDFDGNTWRVGLDWTPLNKTGFAVEWYRVPRSVIDINTAFVLTRGVTFGPRWAPTEKLVFALNFDRERQRFSDPTNPVLGPFALDETVRRWRLTAGWEPVRRLELSAGLERGERSSNGINRDYDYAQLMANARYRF
jgi:exopolysaccharide biosynthesis operon protein EpsL